MLLLSTVRLAAVAYVPVFATISFAATLQPPSSGLGYLGQEVNFLSSQGNRVTGSPAHNALIDRIQLQLEQLGLVVHTDTLNFTYFDGPLAAPSIEVGGKNVSVTSYSKYSGKTGPGGVSGRLIDLTTSSIEAVPDWSKARGAIALANLTNIVDSGKNANDLWPGSPPYPPGNYVTPDRSAQLLTRTLVQAASAGVKGIVWAWQGASTGTIEGMWSPFHNLYQGTPTLFVQGEYGGLQQLQEAAKNSANATLSLYANMVQNTPSRTLWVVFEGTQTRNESMLINTHTDGTNTIEENGYIALLAHAQRLAANPPNRTTVLIFAGQHLQYEAFGQAPLRATSRWLNDHPEYWAGEGYSAAFDAGGQLKAVAGTCVEHMGAIEWSGSVANNTWHPTNSTVPETLYAATPELDDLLRQTWHGAEPNITRVTNPSADSGGQGGEGYSYFLYDIPNISLITNPNYLLKIWPDGFNTSKLVDLDAMQRQVESFFRVWDAMDGMTAEQFGTQPTNGTSTALHTGNDCRSTALKASHSAQWKYR